MSVLFVGCEPPADLRVEPLAAFEGTGEVQGDVPAGCPEVEERLACARFKCQKGGRELTGNDCLMCTRYRGWRDGPGPSHITIRCGWSHLAPVWARMTQASALVTVPDDLSCQEAEEIARGHGVRHLLVMSGGRLAGVVCRCDFHPTPSDDERVSDRMAHDVFAIRGSASLGEAAAAFSSLKVGCLPVVEEGILAGVITRGDLRRAGAPETLLGAHACTDCQSSHGVTADPNTGHDLCLKCLDEAFVLEPYEYGPGG